MRSRFDENTLAEIRHRLPDYLEASGVVLSPKGTRLVGRCPVHDDRSPSFAVFGSDHENCGCHPCGFTGDVFKLSQWLGRSSSFPDAVREVAAVLGVHLSQEPNGRATRPATARKRTPKPTTQPFKLTAADNQRIHRANLAFDDAFFSGDPIISEIADSLGVNRETLRIASWGSSGLGIANGWLCYVYPQGLKWRNPDPKAKPRFIWIAGKALAPWRMDWVKPETRTVYLTEGESDTIALIAAGVEADGTAVSVASPGTSFSKEWAPLFKGKRVVICFDSDPPGRTATATVAAILKGHASEVLTWKGFANHE
ncbi:toprim domain-containing protein [Verrucomicrobiaceae bacterium 5K15]|uniref:Toprim domain-containing protein n=1 Tax=Oceaniferula flava TaxID=2800421 RepID=A0AAE2SA17_9BACT|nr:CHC2 zinc finger domain-containing protein [Oceaniferula flavus]MBK1853699.1 toprim domain-containing protein [Oceaniferula flavus]MBM1135005.1 toprim domain-containing protein [Oceaniferula flavus]